MKVLSVAVFSLLFGFSQTTVAGLSCRSHCAACWKTGQPGVDIKIGCGFRGECHQCPPDYESIHCAKSERCRWVDRSMPLFITIPFFPLHLQTTHSQMHRCEEPDCEIFGPCYCGVTENGGKKSCTVPGPGVPCTSWFYAWHILHLSIRCIYAEFLGQY